jgi:GPH family glycoside/pentoside/hexuronide:cation symporter
MIVHIYEFAPLVIWVILIFVLVTYKLDALYPRIMKDLAEREAKGEL